jgi:hypothetical protein
MSISDDDVQDLLEDLGYSFSQMEMNDFSEAVRESNKRKAKRLLIKEGYSDEQADAMYAHCRKEALGDDVDLIEIPKSDWTNLTRDEDYVVRIGRSVIGMSVMYDGTLWVNGSRDITLKQIRQVWKAVKREKPNGQTN